MRERHLDRVLREAGVPELAEVLAGLPADDLQSLLLYVTAERSKRISPARLLQQWKSDRFVRPAAINPLRLAEIERLAFDLASPEFEPVELSPVCPLGTISVLGDLSQDWAVATTRNTEVVSDSTDCLALECASRRQSSKEEVRLCARHRLLRPQKFAEAPATFAHFAVFALATAGRDSGAFRFELASLSSHVRFHLSLLIGTGLPAAGLVVIITAWDEAHLPILESHLRSKVEEVGARVVLDSKREKGRGYYDRFCFEIRAEGVTGGMSFVDGGFADWTAKLLSNQKERLLISGAGTERLALI